MATEQDNRNNASQVKVSRDQMSAWPLRPHKDIWNFLSFTLIQRDKHDVLVQPAAGPNHHFSINRPWLRKISGI